MSKELTMRNGAVCEPDDEDDDEDGEGTDA